MTSRVLLSRFVYGFARRLDYLARTPDLAEVLDADIDPFSAEVRIDVASPDVLGPRDERQCFALYSVGDRRCVLRKAYPPDGSSRHMVDALVGAPGRQVGARAAAAWIDDVEWFTSVHGLPLDLPPIDVDLDARPQLWRLTPEEWQLVERLADTLMLDPTVRVGLRVPPRVATDVIRAALSILPTERTDDLTFSTFESSSMPVDVVAHPTGYAGWEDDRVIIDPATEVVAAPPGHRWYFDTVAQLYNDNRASDLAEVTGHRGRTWRDLDAVHRFSTSTPNPGDLVLLLRLGMAPERLATAFYDDPAWLAAELARGWSSTGEGEAIRALFTWVARDERKVVAVYTVLAEAAGMAASTSIPALLRIVDLASEVLGTISEVRSLVARSCGRAADHSMTTRVELIGRLFPAGSTLPDAEDPVSWWLTCDLGEVVELLTRLRGALIDDETRVHILVRSITRRVPGLGASIWPIVRDLGPLALEAFNRVGPAHIAGTLALETDIAHARSLVEWILDVRPFTPDLLLAICRENSLDGSTFGTELAAEPRRLVRALFGDSWLGRERSVGWIDPRTRRRLS